MFNPDSVQQSVDSTLQMFSNGSQRVFHVDHKGVRLAKGSTKIRNSIGFTVDIARKHGTSFATIIRSELQCTREGFLDIPMYIMYRGFRVNFNGTHVLSVDPKAYNDEIELVDLQLPFEDCFDDDNFFSAQLLYPHFRKDHIIALRTILPVVRDINSKRLDMRNVLETKYNTIVKFLG